MFIMAQNFLDAQGAEARPHVEIMISVAEQRLALVEDGVVVRKFRVSTSKFGLGDNFGSYKTPLGRLRVCGKLGEDLPEGAVFKRRNFSGEVLSVNARGRDPIVTRILWLEGAEALQPKCSQPLHLYSRHPAGAQHWESDQLRLRPDALSRHNTNF